MELVQFASENLLPMKKKLILKNWHVDTFTVLLKKICMFFVLFYCEHEESFIEMLYNCNVFFGRTHIVERHLEHQTSDELVS